jgi:uncharacterized membrane protein
MYSDLLLNRIANPAEDAEAEVQDLITEIEELDSLLSPEAQALIEDLRPHLVTDDVYEGIDERASFGDRVADKLSTFAGSWKFILSFCALMVLWMASNIAMGARAFDPFPFILLNRQAKKDRAVADNDYQVNLKNEVEIADLHRKIDMLTDALTLQTRLVNALVEARRKELSATVKAIENTRGQHAQSA